LNADHFIKLCKLAGLNVVLRKDSLIWEAVYERLPYHSIDYLSSINDYQLEYQRGHGGEWDDFSCVILSDKNPVALWPITISVKDGVANLSSQGRGLLPPIFVEDCSHKTQKSVTRTALNLIDLLSDEIGLQKLISSSSFDGSHAFNNWHTFLMMGGAECYVQHNLYVDLSLPIEKIKSLFRESYKSLINSGERIWNVEVLSSSIGQNVWIEFRALHLAVAGRITRSIESWDLHYHSVRHGESFLVTLRNGAGKMVGAGLFITTKDEGSYTVGVYDRSLFDKPLGHVVQFQAINEMQKRGCRWYFIGRRFYPSDQPTPSEKELSISNFKEGFSTHSFPSIIAVKKYSKK
jgi:FemAB family protein